jgi:tRNA threonylcarbamoyladenosine biosynthesis protein TsaB
VLILAIDTATPRGRFALAEAGVLKAYRPHNVTGSYADSLLPLIDDLLAEAGRGLDEVDLIAVTDGPGSFTGVRIGVATAKTLAWALDAELAAVSTLAAMAADLLHENPGCELAVPVLDARRGEVFAGLFRRSGAWVEDLVPPACLEPDACWRRLSRAEQDLESSVFGGDGVALLVQPGGALRPELAGRGLPVRRAWQAAHPATARILAVALADPVFRASASISPFALTPRYLRGSDAEILRSVDATPRAPVQSGHIDIHTGKPPHDAAHE